MSERGCEAGAASPRARRSSLVKLRKAAARTTGIRHAFSKKQRFEEYTVPRAVDAAPPAPVRPASPRPMAVAAPVRPATRGARAPSWLAAVALVAVALAALDVARALAALLASLAALLLLLHALRRLGSDGSRAGGASHGAILTPVAVAVEAAAPETGEGVLVDALAASVPEHERGDLARLRAELDRASFAALAQLLHRLREKELDDAARAHLWPGDTLARCGARFLAARDWRVAPALALLEADVAWRDEHRPRALTARAPLEVAGLTLDEVARLLPIWQQGFDRDGRPVMFQQYGCVRLREITRCTTLERVRMSHTRCIEQLARLCGEQTQARGRVVDQWIVVVDAEGWDPSNLLTPAVFKWAAHMADVDQNHHPERLFRMFIINTPRVVFTFYRMISGLIAESTRAKIQLFIGPETWMPALAEHIAPDQLPVEYGGTDANRLREAYGGAASDESASKLELTRRDAC